MGERVEQKDKIINDQRLLKMWRISFDRLLELVSKKGISGEVVVQLTPRGNNVNIKIGLRAQKVGEAVFDSGIYIPQ